MRKQKDKLRKQFWKKLEIELPYDPEIPLLGIHTEETRIERDTCTPMFITSLFTITRTWKQPRCPSAEEWIRKLWYIYTMEYYSAIKKNTFESVLARWMKLELIIQSEVSQKEILKLLKFKPGMIWENGIEICILSGKKQITSLCSIQDTGCLGLVHGDDPERCYGEGGGRGVHV